MAEIAGFLAAHPAVGNWYTASVRFLFPVLAILILLRAVRSLLRLPATPESWAQLSLPNGAPIPLTHWENILGRGGAADVRLNFPSVSRQHAAICRDSEGNWTVYDLGSKGGTAVNGEAVTASAPLKLGATVTLGGVPLSEVAETDLMKHVVLVRHNSYLFKGTVEENLRMAKPDATKEEMEAVLQKVNLLGFLQTQNGLQTELLEKAGNLSGGQCQRLVIARALLRSDSAVYIFDEAASNIDVESEELIMNVIHELAKTKTVLLISHRLANVVQSDQIYFLKNGTICERGTHAELMEQNGAYRHLYDSQMVLENYGKQGNA